MQYLLTEEEHEALAPTELYANLLHSVEIMGETLVGRLCLRNTNKQAYCNYCDECPLHDLKYDVGPIRDGLCKNQKEFSK